MPTGYLVSLGDGSLDAFDVISGSTITFTSTTNLGAGEWTWSGTYGGVTYTNELEPGEYHLDASGNVYFVPSYGPVDTISSATVTSAPSYIADDSIYGTMGDDVTLYGTGDADVIYGGSTTSETGTANDTIDAGAGDDQVTAGDGADTVRGGGGDDEIYGGTGDDVIYGDAGATLTSTSESLNWDQAGVDGTNIAGGFTQTTGDMDVTVRFDTTALTTAIRVEATDTAYVGTGEAFDPNSNLYLTGGGPGVTSTTHIDFAATTGSGVGNEVENVTFRVNDIDRGGWTDVVTINAYDANGNLVPVTFQLDGDETLTGNTITAGAAGDSVSSINGSALITIAGPVSRIEIIYENTGTAGQALWVSDVHFDTIVPADGDDTIYGGAGADTIFGEGGADTIYGGTDDDTISGGTGADNLQGGEGSDSFIIEDGFGADVITGGEAGSDDDWIDFSALTSGVDVTFSGDEAGSATDGADTLTYTEIEGVTLTDQADTVDASADTTGVSVEGGAGADVMIGGSGGDTFSGGGDADSFVVGDGFGNDTFVGGEGGDDNDTLDLSGLSTGVQVVFTGDEAGTATSGTNQVTFSEVENIALTAQDDVFDASATTLGVTADGGAGDDTLTGGSGADTLTGGIGDDMLYGGVGDALAGGDGDDTFYIDPSALGGGTITIEGGEGAETSGDTLDFGGLLSPGSIVYSNGNDAAGGLSGTATLVDGTIVNFTNIETIICFSAGTRLETPHGPRKVETLVPGDLILTRDNGPQPVRWIGRRQVRGKGRFAPVHIGKGRLGNHSPLLVSPQHRMLIRDPMVEYYFGEAEALVAAKHLIDGVHIWQEDRDMVEYVHILFDRHEVVFAEGAASESFHPAQNGLDAVEGAAREELFSIFPELRSDPGTYGHTARRCLKRHEAKVLRAA